MSLRDTIYEFVRAYPGGKSQFLQDVGISESRLSQIANGDPAQPDVAKAIHRASKGKLPASLLRPDLWRRPQDVPIEIAGAA
jgi:DNA-binding transcriptional regulator YdaS (Cro superfamily)